MLKLSNHRQLTGARFIDVAISLYFVQVLLSWLYTQDLWMGLVVFSIAAIGQISLILGTGLLALNLFITASPLRRQLQALTRTQSIFVVIDASFLMAILVLNHGLFIVNYSFSSFGPRMDVATFCAVLGVIWAGVRLPYRLLRLGDLPFARAKA